MTTIQDKIILPCALTGRITSKFNSDVSAKVKSSVYFVRANSNNPSERTINVKSLLGLLSEQFQSGEEILVTLNGENETACYCDLALIKKILSDL